ncbi:MULTISPECIES: dipeptidase PepV [unclassified Halanaerobium]|uniref:dipeptidase PepV n=1 Tax=unclassified Halanaerobium TaxID=2641197 RepID=UPI000DF49734|nr:MULTISPECIES: dipeptidase PepV [unclassified Halanaerobium]RCW51543.1 succinyl-diaminopimelate desuccinylase [Halanaerobium sp. MA284_MarDTE_T2]RCW89331.1 succinyl-diaminopimelate desuccinylase [Halanaerobium sp. DL-01]
MKEIITKKAENLREDIVSTIQEWIKIPSVEGEPADNMPFGKKVHKALTAALKKGEELGFKVKNVDNYAGHIEIGEGEDILAVLCHLDVVPEGSGWTYPPYAAEIHDGKIYGRGTIDDKGPAVAALYALKIVDELDIKLNKKVRLILGTNEESGMKGIDYYLKKEKMPDLAFSPDATFPAIYAEKGILDLEFTYPLKKSNSSVSILSIKGGSARNMVPDFCEVKLEGIDKKTAENLLSDLDYDKGALNLEENNSILTASYKGVSAHGSTPQEGVNAISRLLRLLPVLVNDDNPAAEFINFYNKKIGLESDGKSIGCADNDQVSGDLTFNVGVIDLDTDKVKFYVNIRYPVSSDGDKVINDIKESIPKKLIVKKYSEAKPLFVEKDDPFIVTLMNAYREFTGDDRDPIAIGGGTYARKMKKGVAFGPLFPGEKELAHQKDEFISIDNLIKSTAIYAKSIIDIAGAK